jgi:peptidoglycan/LPS O-acetylase OafA/YrhL
MTHSSNYRPDIDGLLAIAIAGVVLFHLWPTALGGGYVGVDVFFVISGYLITSIIHRDISAGSFSLVGFYERRIRRIFPAFLVVLLATLVAGFFLLLPGDLSSLAGASNHAIASISNVFFYHGRVDYYNNEFGQNPIIHTWSLGVEEQFYLALPVFLLVVSKFLKSTRLLAPLLIVVFLVSLAASVHQIQIQPMKVFFLTPYRAWELLLGSILALTQRSQPRSIIGNFAGLGGLGLILASMLCYTEDTPFPGLMALFPCAGSALLIFAGQNRNGLATRLLSSKPFVGLGLISYSVYLWHWPLITFAKYGHFTGPWSSAGVLAASLCLGILSWRFIEQPFRVPGFMSPKQVYISWAVSSLMVLAIGFAIVRHDGLPGRFDNLSSSILAHKQTSAVAQDRAGGGQKGKFTSDDFDFLSAPVYGNATAQPSFALWGDSFANALRPLVETMAKEKGVAFRSFGLPGVAPVIGIVPRARESYREKVLAYSKGVVDYIRADPTLKTVIIHANWRLYVPEKKPAFSWQKVGSAGRSMRDFQTEKRFAMQLKTTVDLLLEAGKQVVIVYPIPRPPCNIPDYLARFSISGKQLPETIAIGDYWKQEESVLVALKSLSDKEGRLIRVYPHAVLMKDDGLLIMANNLPLYYDARHLSQPGAMVLRSLFESVFSKM